MCLHRTFTTHDGEALFFRHWPGTTETPAGAVLLLHRGHEHGGRMAHLVDELDLPDHAFYALDTRGHGLSPGPRGHAPSFAALVKDLDCLVAHLNQHDGVATDDLMIVAQSIGAVIAAGWVHDFAPELRGMVLAAPAFRVRLYVPFARQWLALGRRLFGPFHVTSYVSSSMLTHDVARAVSYDEDPLVTRPISVDLLLELAAAGDRLVQDAAAITTPTFVVLSGADAVVDSAAQHEFFVNLGSPIRERYVAEGFFHDTLGEQDRADVLRRVRGFIHARFGEPVETVSWLDAHRRSYTRDEAEALASPLPALSLARARWAVTRWVLRTAARVSDGLELGYRVGFDSGESLDYVYRNEADGQGLLGRAIDRLYLEQVGWRGIRERKQLVESLIVDALERLHAEGRPRVVLDVAAGHGRYVLDAMARTEVSVDAVVLRDQAVPNATSARLLVDQRGLRDRVRFHVEDAFDVASFEGLTPRPTLGIVSGLYELYPDNTQVLTSLRGLAAAIEPGGYLIYTCQPWHPQLELIARALTSHLGGGAWVMRRRTQAEMDQLVEAAGFTKLDQWVERQGLFTVALAQRSS